ncbi:hypothetical protein [Myroides indicus]|uniref:Lipoprotein n=1 Tax=Myroides indicus TaxID=1323422 RepID=A0A4R7ES00_9FLAO|nr:hypothetical protein [Myroides indicus]TDS55906.1 hypothetical protein C8P70_12126 [Myroides indicus]
MKKYTFLFCALFLFLQCGSIKSQLEQTQEQTKLAFELCQLYGSDQGIRDKALSQKSRIVMPSLDSINFIKLVDFVKEHGMPNEKLVGKENYKIECVKLASFSILLHNPEKLVHNEDYYDLFLQEVQAGRMNPETLALVIDKYYWANNKSLIYGSQFGKPCLKDKTEVNQRRNILGLKDLDDEDFKICD